MPAREVPLDENPITVNVVSMVPVIFCLIAFFLCSFRFKQLEGKFDSWLPKETGAGGTAGMTDTTIIEEIRIALFWDEPNQRTIRMLRNRVVPDDAELQDLIRQAHTDYRRLNRPDAPVIIDADARVPWGEVVNVVNLARRNGIEKVEFALGAAPPQK